MNKEWYKIKNLGDIISPALMVYPDRIEKNISTMIAMAGGTQNLRPHIKTHKTAEIVQLQLNRGIQKFKCATIAEAELLGNCGAADILLALQPVGPNINRFFRLIAEFPNSIFSTIVDDAQIVEKIAKTAKEKGIRVPLWLDINSGMNRSGILPNAKAAELYKKIYEDPNLKAAGLHVYDGHIRDKDLFEREQKCNEEFEVVLDLKKSLENQGFLIPTIVAGGSPTFPIHLKREGVETSPGTTLLWDAGYATSYKDMEFLPAAVLLTRVISKPNSNLVCFDLGHKHLASEMNFPRVLLLEGEVCSQIGQSEEHLMVQCPNDEMFTVGDVAYAIPVHICPTVAKYKEVLTVVDGCLSGAWQVAARNLKIKI
ncbi:D-TA family PLP-dependent enzyme [Arenibacter troitsensis]|uniref:D-serine deaminase, pyridoxal phosphate-dependent n=1 Tax=Arenibacter troitsensis TaxID=188872 RepID=A0A1X7JSA6_9FLAO|nr:D-TA family PLP-dependent enzyme [Arenibacter troitsensis]SMG31231.1 D-serine deaminase, pyridoxal phosphate-dependent [Arenibacter troitsensis]